MIIESQINPTRKIGTTKINPCNLKTAASRSLIPFNQFDNMLKLNSTITCNYIKPFIVFKGNSDAVKIEQTRLYQSFKKAGANPDKIFEFIKDTTASPSEHFEFLLSVTADPKWSKGFIKEITKNPNESRKNIKLLINKLGGEKNYFDWFYAKQGYYEAFENYTKDFFKDAKSVEELLKFQPNWGFWRLEEKYLQQNNPYYTELELNEKQRDCKLNFAIGKIPQEFLNLSTYNSLINNLKKLNFGAKNVNLYLNGNTFNIDHLEGGDLNYKNIYKVQINGKKFIVKTDRLYPEDLVNRYTDNKYLSRITKESRLNRGDSIYLDACMDYYLQENGCSDKAKFYSYDFETDSAIYEYIDGKTINYEANNDPHSNLVKLNKKLINLTNLGIYCNDVGKGYNYMIDSQGRTKVVDLGHANYIDGLKPGCVRYHTEMTNMCGPSLLTTMASIQNAANDLFTSPLEIKENSFTNLLKGTGNPISKDDTLQLKSYLTMIAQDQIKNKDYDSAKSTLKLIVRILKDIFPENNIEIAKTYDNLGKLYTQIAKSRLDSLTSSSNKEADKNKILLITNKGKEYVQKAIDIKRAIGATSEEKMQSTYVWNDLSNIRNKIL